MMKQSFRAFFPLLSLLLLVVSTGCEEVIDPVIEVPEKRSIAVVPFRDEQFDIGFESPRGCELADDVTRKLAGEGEYAVVPQRKILALYDPNVGQTPTAREVAAKTGADYVIMGSVVHWGTRDEDMIPGGLLRGSASIEVTLYETYDGAVARAKSDKEKEELPPLGRGRVVVAKRRVDAVFPHEYGMTNFGTTELTQAQIEDGLKLAAARAVAWLLIPHTKDDEKKAEGK